MTGSFTFVITFVDQRLLDFLEAFRGWTLWQARGSLIAGIPGMLLLWSAITLAARHSSSPRYLVRLSMSTGHGCPRDGEQNQQKNR